MKIGVALSGGGFRGAAHIGVLKALNERKIPIDMISGSSMGGVVAALYASGYTPDEIGEIIGDLNLGFLSENTFYTKLKNAFGKCTFQTSKIVWDGILGGNKIEKLLKDALLKKGVTYFSDMKMPAVVTGLDIDTMRLILFASDKDRFIDNGDCIHLSDVPVWEALRATISLPLIFKPKVINGLRLIDGGIKNNLPISATKTLGASRILASNIVTDYAKCKAENMLDIFLKTMDFLSAQNTRCILKGADYVLDIKFDSIAHFEFAKTDQFINFGYDSAILKMDAIENNLLINS